MFRRMDEFLDFWMNGWFGNEEIDELEKDTLTA